MFCYQCEQAAGGTGCTKVGVCGKQPDVAALQDLIVWGLKGMAFWADQARQKGSIDRDIDVHMVEGLFTTVTNVNFDPESCAEVARKTARMRDKAQQLFEKANSGPFQGEVPEAARPWQPAGNTADLVAEGRKHPVKDSSIDPDVKSVMEMLVYGMKGMAAYADHAHILGHDDDAIYGFLHKAMAATLDRSKGLMDFVNLCMECGTVNLKTQQLLYEGNSGHYGHPQPTKVAIGNRGGKAILVSGHDLKMLDELLKQTEGKGINVYTHVEMLPAHGYPGLKKYPHLVGNYGGGWQEQYKEFSRFPGAIIFNTNCIQRPAEVYKDRLFTWGLVQWPGVKHIEGWDFSPVIEAAQKAEAWDDNPQKEILTGCGHHAILGLADKVIEAVKAGAIRRFYVIGGCDGAKPGRNYYTQMAEQLPRDTVILTLACGKYRFNKLELGDIGGIPRLLDVGQCNDTYSAVQVALALANAFNCGVNDLPLSVILSWYEQKAVVCLLSLLSLNMQHIRVGPSLPAFVTPNVLNFLVENFKLAPIGTVAEDIQATLAGR
ncbi:MAG: hydroxylamine reductase [Desulfuromonadales bacterium]|nr:hydroxylamine reductase [Desulfuromonadales bacterium]